MSDTIVNVVAALLMIDIVLGFVYVALNLWLSHINREIDKIERELLDLMNKGDGDAE